MEVTCALLDQQRNPPYIVEGGTPYFESRDTFKAKALYAGLTPAVAEDQGRSFNATARQLRGLGFLVKIIEKEGTEQKIAFVENEEKAA